MINVPSGTDKILVLRTLQISMKNLPNKYGQKQKQAVHGRGDAYDE